MQYRAAKNLPRPNFPHNGNVPAALKAGNVTLHPAVAPQLVNESESVAAPERNAGALLAR